MGKQAARTAKGLWLKEEKTDNGWVDGQVRSYNARLGDFVAGSNPPKLEDMKSWRRAILEYREKWAERHKAHTSDKPEFGCRHCQVAGWVKCAASNLNVALRELAMEGQDG